MFGKIPKMPSMRYIASVLLFVFVSTAFPSFAQQAVSIPGFTGYVYPEIADNDTLFTEAGLNNWTGAQQKISYFFQANVTGKLQIAITARNAKSSSAVKVSVAGKSFTIHIPKSTDFQQVAVGEVNIPQTGFYQLEFQPVVPTTKAIGDIQSIRLSGDATKNIQFNAKNRRNAASVHLNYPLPDSVTDAVAFYNEVTVPKGADIPYSYYMACGFARGYFGMQVNDKKERRVIFSVWDAGNEAVDRKKVADTNKVRLIAKGDGVFASDFGNEGTGGHSHWVYNWKADSTYKFFVTALPDSATQTTTYSGYFYAPELKAWKFIASFRAPRDGTTLHHLYSFLEDFVGTNGQQPRKGYYSNAWVRDEDNKWTELTKAKFSCDATGRAGDRIDFGGGTDTKRFYLWNGGFKPGDAKLGDSFNRVATGKAPTVNLYHNVDSLLQAKKDIEIINKAVRDGVIDTTASAQGVFYEILQEGSGRKVKVTDTLSVFYKGWVLNGNVFDSTKKEPAKFPLNKLIKGWQYGLVNGKVGGKIRLVMPSGLAYSVRSRALEIPPDSILVFDIEVLDAKE